MEGPFRQTDELLNETVGPGGSMIAAAVAVAAITYVVGGIVWLVVGVVVFFVVRGVISLRSTDT
jgi:hypothetical protein